MTQWVKLKRRKQPYLTESLFWIFLDLQTMKNFWTRRHIRQKNTWFKFGAKLKKQPPKHSVYLVWNTTFLFTKYQWFTTHQQCCKRSHLQRLIFFTIEMFQHYSYRIISARLSWRKWTARCCQISECTNLRRVCICYQTEFLQLHCWLQDEVLQMFQSRGTLCDLLV